MFEDTKSYIPSEMGSMKIRDIPEHHKGFKNQWGALLDQQAEIQRLADEQEKHNQLAKNNKYKDELKAQLALKDSERRLEKQVRQNPNEQKLLSDDYKRFEQKEFDRMNMGRSKSKQVMLENQHIIKMRQNEYINTKEMDRDMFNRQAMEDNLHAEKANQEKKKWHDWQKESLKNNYEQQMQRKDYLTRMEKEKDRVYADQYKHSVEAYEKNHNDTLNNLRRRNNEIMDHQIATVIPNVNDKRKDDAVNKMKKQFESTEKETLMKELKRLNHRNKEAQETSKMLKLQMDMRKKKYESDVNEEKHYKNYVDNTINMLGERDRKMAQEKEQIRQTYAKELESQIKEHNDKEKRIYNEMDERSLKLNQRGLAAYETGERATGLFKLPGIDRESKDNREYFGRYAKRKEGSRFGGSLANSHTGPLSERMNRDLPKTSEEYLSRRRSSRGAFSPKSHTSNILGQPINNNSNKNIPSLGNYKSVANLQTPHKVLPTADSQRGLNDMNVLTRKSTTMLSARKEEVPEYQPTERDHTARRSNPVNESNLVKATAEKPEIKKEIIKKPATQAKPKMEQGKFSVKKDLHSLADIDTQLNQRVLGSMRGGTFKLNSNN
ncbi:unnamed protein product [Moneuplotes crassus]|uniref:Uncharacterized protein n=1 Tax=Euplotes crassus TaxID=5936 RepID=A0AAD1U430_EUPCR|nr:unnamed protein product [Moneuplotes crassus]